MINPDRQRLTSKTNHKNITSILLVDDDPQILDALEMCLEELGTQIVKASDGKSALEILNSQMITVIICDLGLPDYDGIELLKETVEIQPDCIRIALTGNAESAEAIDLINIAQISHFILKPWDYQSLLQTVRSGLDHVRLVLDNRRLTQVTQEQNKKLLKSYENLNDELKLGGRIQNLLLKGNSSKSIEGIYMESISIPSKEVDGDFFETYQPLPHLVDIVLGDVMGKGLPAALVGTAVKSQLSRYADPLVVKKVFEKSKGWHRDILGTSEILKQVHRQLIKPLENLEFFVSLFYGRFDLHKRTFTYVDCGSTKPIHYKTATNTTEFIKGSNFPLGIISDDSYSEESITYDEGDTFLFYSDGITESRSPEGELYSAERLNTLFIDNIHLSAKDLKEKIKDDVTNFTKELFFSDDFTLLIINIEKGPTNFSYSTPFSSEFKSDLKELNAVRGFIESFCVQISDFPTQVTELLILAVNEAFSNIVRHGMSEGEKKLIKLQAHIEDNDIIIELLDQGNSYDPSAIQHPNFTGRKESGFGFYIIKSVSDEVSYTPKKDESGFNCLQIRKKFKFNEDTMQFSNYNKDGVLVIKLEGENLDAKEVPDFKKNIMSLIEQEGSTDVVFDLSRLTFIDSTGLGSFLSILRSLNGMQGNLKLTNMTRSIHAIFELVCMNKIFEIYSTVDEAIGAYQIAKATKQS